MKKILTGLFREVFNREYDPDSRDDHILIQKVTYFMTNRGLNLGQFWFSWDKNGPFSLDLRNAVLDEVRIHECEPFEYSTYARKQIDMNRTILAEGAKLELTDVFWFELICSLHFLKKYVVVGGDEAVIQKLVDEKPQFSNKNVNTRALQIVKTIESMGYLDGADTDYET